MSTYVGAIGIAVSDLDRSVKFYTDVIGMVVLQTINVDYMDEVILGFAGSRSASVALMQFNGSVNPVTGEGQPDCANNPVKLVFYVGDAVATMKALGNAGYRVVSEPVAYSGMGNALIGFGKDPDGYTIELIQKPPKK